MEGSAGSPDWSLVERRVAGDWRRETGDEDRLEQAGSSVYPLQ